MSISVTEAKKKFFDARRAARYSENTLTDYGNTLRKFESFVGGDTPLDSIGVDKLITFMGSPDVLSVSKKTALNYLTGISSFWQWAVESGYCESNIARQVKPPKPEKRDIIPYTHKEISKLLLAAQDGQLARRDIAIILVLLDTGMRASELGNIKIKSVYFADRQILVFGKGSKERRLRISKATKNAIIRYLNWRGCLQPSLCRNEYLFIGKRNKKMTRNTVRLLCERLAIKSSVAHVFTHKFRYTFAIEFLRNGGNIFTLQKLLGHTTLDMVKRYLAIAQSDVDRDHDRASPVENWHLKDELL